MKENLENFFVQDGVVEYFKDNLVILSASVLNVKNISKDYLDNLNKDTQDKLRDKNITDHDRYMLNYKLEIAVFKTLAFWLSLKLF